MLKFVCTWIWHGCRAVFLDLLVSLNLWTKPSILVLDLLSDRSVSPHCPWRNYRWVYPWSFLLWVCYEMLCYVSEIHSHTHTRLDVQVFRCSDKVRCTNGLGCSSGVDDDPPSPSLFSLFSLFSGSSDSKVIKSVSCCLEEPLSPSGVLKEKR